MTFVQRRYRHVMLDLLDAVIAGEYAEGDRLPGERAGVNGGHLTSIRAYTGRPVGGTASSSSWTLRPHACSAVKPYVSSAALFQ